ncbi:MAG: YtxH domain-containing protein [Candidatus Magasanikbacteria bacterium]|nr:YtxH domain-containing protein [Candidatus Magasanikbacteria bacterium]
MTSTLTKTAIVGGVLGAALFAFLKTKKGKQIKNQLHESLDELYSDVEDKLRDLGDATQEKYNEVVQKVVQEYSDKKMLATKVVVDITDELKKRWEMFQLYYLYNQVKSELRTVAEPSQIGFNKTVQDVVDEYARDKRLAKEEVATLSNEIKKKWREFKREIAS